MASSSAFAPPDSPVPAPRATTLNPFGGGEPDDGGDVLGRLGEHDGTGPVVFGPLGVVVRVFVATLGVGEDLISPQELEERAVTESAAVASARMSRL